MLVNGENLYALNEQYKIVSGSSSFDTNSFTLHLHKDIKWIKPPEGVVVHYNEDLPPNWIVSARLDHNGVIIKPGEAFLACTTEIIQMPAGYFGLIQTKGSLARLFISATCSDGQVEPGYHGNLTLEFSNCGNFPVQLLAGDEVAQLFIFRTSSKKAKSYEGRYQNAIGPTHYKRKNA